MGKTSVSQVEVAEDFDHAFVARTHEKDRMILTVKAVILARDQGLRSLLKEYRAFKREFISKIQEAVRKVIKGRDIEVYAQQKWMVDQKLARYVRNLPLHPMPFHNQSVWLEEKEGRFFIHLKTKQDGEAVCHLLVPPKYRSMIQKACGKDNPVLGQVELIEDKKYGRINVHITLRLPKPKPYKPRGWIGVDVGWNKLATSILVTANPILHFSDPTVHGKDYKTRMIQLKYLLKQYARSGRSWKKWGFRLKHMIKNAVGVVAKEIVKKARKHRAGVSMEKLTFRSSTKRWLIPRYKLVMAVKNLCERNRVPFIQVPAKNTSITCPKCDYISKANRSGKRFECKNCGYKADADFVASMNIGKEAISVSFTPTDKTAKLNAEAEGKLAMPINR